MRKLSQFLVIILFVVSCTPSDVSNSRRTALNTIPGGASSNGNNATNDSTTTTTSSILPKVEIRHLIEPNLSTDTTYNTGTGLAGGGSYVRKMTLPKNFAGRLYVAGINIGTLMNRIVKVRFKFGVGREPVTITGTIVQAPGITPQTSINVIVLDLRSEPFRNIRLPYDLFDYTDYGASDTPTQNNLDSGLYCRGLKVEDDPTFQGVGACDGNQAGEECLYAYAKILDQGLVKNVSGTLVPITPTLPQVMSTTGTYYYQDTVVQHLKKPIVDAAPAGNSYLFSQAATGNSATANITFAASLFSAKVFPTDGATYYYQGPYRLINTASWEYQFSDLVGSSPSTDKRLFKSSIAYTGPVNFPDNPTQTTVYYQSFMFPLATKLNLSMGVPHLASATYTGTRSEVPTLAAAGSTLWMDGSNARVQSKNTDLEHVGSCNVTSSIEIIAKDSNNVDYVVAVARDVKLQLVRPAQYATDTGNEVLYTNFKTCSSNASCGSSECCFNSRCWDEGLVSQCFDSTSIQGNRTTGDACVSDFQCLSICCNRTTGLCASHNTILTSPVLCSKPIGDTCIAKEWCQRSPVTKCLIVKTGTDSQGNVTCRQQCYTTNEYADCKAGICVPPFQDTISPFDPNAANACDDAVDPPSF